tara:strand:- start:38554 stop:41199 length:2646 start_codon:yes stop_codon:yes gene_type:complete
MMKQKKLATAVGAVLAATSGLSAGQEIEAPQVPQIEEVFVLGEFIPDEKRDTSEISELLTAADMSLTGDSDVGEALERVTGLSLVGGKFVYVRGLGERYSSTLINGSPISSPVPFQKTVPLDIVPNGLVSSLLVQKTFSPEYSGDFSGGLVLIRTQTLPEENFLSVSVKSGGNSQATNGDGLSYTGGSRDNSGWDDGTRDIPQNLRAVGPDEFNAADFPQSAAYGNSFYNNWDIDEKQSLTPDFETGIEGGYRFDLDNGMALGITAAGQYKNQWRNQDTDMRRYEFSGVEGGSTQTVDFREFTTTQTVDVTGFLNLGLEINNDHSLSLTSMILRQTTDTVEQRKGLSSEDDVSSGTEVESYFLEWVENEIRSTQLSGEHFFPSLNDSMLRWRAVDGESQRKAPDTRSYTYADNRDGLQEMVTPNRQAAGDLREVYQAPQRGYSNQNDEIQDLGFDIEVPLSLADIEFTLKAGGAMYERSRDVEERLFRFDLTPLAEDFVPLETPSQFFGTPNWQSGALAARDFTNGAANASGIFPFASSSEEVDAWYVGVDAQLTDRLRVQAGARLENADLEADAWGGNTEEGTINAVKQDYEDTLPALSITYELFENMQIRGAYSETVNRPSLLEITGSTIRNPGDGNFYRGNVFLQQATLKNYDTRWEWYFGTADTMSVGAFYKEFVDPIEIGKVQAQNDIYTWFNAEEAELKGIEYDVRKELYLADWFELHDNWNYFTVSFNVTYIDSEVTLLGSGETADDVPLTGGRKLAQVFSNTRSMSGQSDWLGNLILSYDNYDLGLRGSIAYNYTDERIALVGDRNAPDILEEGRGQLDATIKYEFAAYDQQLELELKARNLLDETRKWTQGGLLYEEFKPGIDWTIGLSWRF